MDPQKNVARPQTNQSDADWNEENPASAANATDSQVAMNGSGMPPVPPAPAPTEATVGGPDMPSITDEQPLAVAATPSVNPVMPVQSVPVPPVAPNAAAMPLGSTPPSEPGSASQPSAGAPSSEPSVHHPASVTFMLIGLAVLIAVVLAIFVLPMLF